MSFDNRKSPRRFGSLIRLRPEYEERYIILHHHPFPGVLQRLRKSRITNFSIFLYAGILFSYYEYAGEDYERDMQAVANDSITQDWWKLTDPMQEAFPDRLPGDWWYPMEEIGFLQSNAQLSEKCVRHAFIAEDPVSFSLKDRNLNLKLGDPAIKFCLFGRKNSYFAYFEISRKSPTLDSFQKEAMCREQLDFVSGGAGRINWLPMRSVFYLE